MVQKLAATIGDVAKRQAGRAQDGAVEAMHTAENYIRQNPLQGCGDRCWARLPIRFVHSPIGDLRDRQRVSVSRGELRVRLLGSKVDLRLQIDMSLSATNKYSPRPSGELSIPALLILSKSIQSRLHNLQGGIHRCVLIAGNLIWQEVNNPYHTRGASVLREDLK